MRTIRLLDEFEAKEIRVVTADLAAYRGSSKIFSDLVRLPICVAYQAEGELKPATKRATCRLCGEKIKTGLQLSFFYDEEQNSWTAKEYHVHAEGCPELESSVDGYDEGMAMGGDKYVDVMFGDSPDY